MLLLGRDLSPFVRRTATVLNLLSLPYERKIVNTADDLDTIREFNPLGRIPALQIGDEEVLIDSHAIIDYLLEQGDSQGRLLAKNGELRRATLRHSAMATGIMEKGVACAYELNQRPKEFVYEPYRDRIKDQLARGLDELNSALGDSSWFGGDAANLADVNAVVAYDFVGIVAPGVVGGDQFPRLAALSESANALTEFAATKWQGA